MKCAGEDSRNEHEGILLGLGVLGNMVGNSKAKLEVDDGDLGDMADFLKVFADKRHHGKEEGFLFPAMEKYGIPKDRGPIGQMLSEHEEEAMGKRAHEKLNGTLDAFRRKYPAKENKA